MVHEVFGTGVFEEPDNTHYRRFFTASVCSKYGSVLKMITIMNFVSALLISGSFGNYADRIVHGGVIDFISVKGFAVFNVAYAFGIRFRLRVLSVLKHFFVR